MCSVRKRPKTRKKVLVCMTKILFEEGKLRNTTFWLRLCNNIPPFAFPLPNSTLPNPPRSGNLITPEMETIGSFMIGCGSHSPEREGGGCHVPGNGVTCQTGFFYSRLIQVTWTPLQPPRVCSFTATARVTPTRYLLLCRSEEEISGTETNDLKQHVGGDLAGKM